MSSHPHMQGVWLENRSLQLREDLAVPVPKKNEALVKVRLAGICGTDLQLLNGYYAFIGIPGHEFVGEVISAVGAPHLAGKRVVGEINIGCGHCPMCDAGLSRHCGSRQVLGIKHRHGAFAQFLTLPIANLHTVPDSLADDKAVFTEPIAAAARILEQITVAPDDTVTVIGAGRLGLLIAQVLKTTPCRLQVVARHENQRRMLQRFNICSVSESNPPPHLADVVVEASGSPGGLHAALRAIKPTGTIVLKSTYAGEPPVNLSSLVVDEIRVQGSRCGRFAPALSLLQSNAVDPTPLIPQRFALHDAAKAYAAAAQPGAMKVLLQIQT